MSWTFGDITLTCAGGVSGALSRITGALGKGIATLSFDQEYQRKRREQQAQPVDLKEGLARGGKGLVMVSHFLISSRYYLIMTFST